MPNARELAWFGAMIAVALALQVILMPSFEGRIVISAAVVGIVWLIRRR